MLGTASRRVPLGAVPPRRWPSTARGARGAFGEGRPALMPAGMRRCWQQPRTQGRALEEAVAGGAGQPVRTRSAAGGGERPRVGAGCSGKRR